MSWTDELTSRDNDKQKQAEEQERQRIEFVESLSPMVSRVLVELGKALWGRGLFGYKYHFFYNTISWNVSTHKLPSDYGCVVQVSIKNGKYFHIDCRNHSIDYRDKLSSTSKDSGDLSETALKKALLDACEEMKWKPLR